MRPLTTFLIAAICAACFGVAISQGGRSPDLPQEQQQPGGQQTGPAQLQPHADKRTVLPLEPVRVPKSFGSEAFAHVEELVSYGPRYSAKPAGMPGWTQQLAYIERVLQGHGLTPKRDIWTDRKELITFTNLSVLIPGSRPERIVLGCHHDTKCTIEHPDQQHNFEFVGANDGGSAVGLLLALAPILAAQEREATIEIVFFDGEESLDWGWNDAARALFGSKRFVRRHRDAELLGEEGRIAAMILLDMVGRKDLHIQDELYSTLNMRQILWSAAKACGHDAHFFQRAEGAKDDHVPFLEVGIPAVDLIDLNGNPTWHTPADTLEIVSPDSMRKIAEVVLTMLPAVESQYVLQKD